jgi:hypothetical protein
VPRAALCALAAVVLVLGLAGSLAAADPPVQVVPLVPPPSLPQPGMVSEPHLALDPTNPAVLVAVAQTRAVVAWRSEDAGRSWTASPALLGKGGRGVASGDPVVAIGPDGSVLFGALAFDPEGRCTLLQRVGSYRSQDGGRSFAPLTGAGQTIRLPRRFFGRPSCPIPKGLTHLSVHDKEWIAVDVTGGARRGSVYLVWTIYDQYPDGRIFGTLLFAASRDGGKTYGRPIAVSPRTRMPDLLEHLSQVAVRPDGTVDVVWNELRNGAFSVVHAASSDGGGSFSTAEPVALLPGNTTPVGLVTSLAVSPAGKLAVCWSASILPKAYLPRVGCSLSSGDGKWSQPGSPFAGGRQYLPAAAFQGERLWVAAYRSSATATRVLLTRSDDGKTFAEPIVLAERPYGRSVVCAPHPPNCTPKQRFVGDYIGAVAAPGKVWVDFVLPAGKGTSPNRVFVATLTTD